MGNPTTSAPTLIVPRRAKTSMPPASRSIQNNNHSEDDSSSTSSPTSSRYTTTTSVSPSADAERNSGDISRYIALGCLHSDQLPPSLLGPRSEPDWVELLYHDLPDDLKLMVGDEATTLLNAQWVRLFLHQSNSKPQSLHSLVRVYVLPEDWGRKYIDRSNKTLKALLRQVLQRIDTSPQAWCGDYRGGDTCRFDIWASAENVSLDYLFNTLPSPAPDPEKIKSRCTRLAVSDLLRSAAHSEWEDHGEQPLAGLKTRLYPYQARSASLMIQREAAPELHLDPILEARTSPDGKSFFFGARDGSFLQEPRYYEANRGGILAETMGLGKTLICLAVILTTKGHHPQIPGAFLPSPIIRTRVGSLADMAASTIGRHSVPARALIERREADEDTDYSHLKDAFQRNIPFYELPYEAPRNNRNSMVPPPRQLVLCSGTIIVVPRNLLDQWRLEIHKHVLVGGLRVLVVDSAKPGSKAKHNLQDTDIMEFVNHLPAPTELMKFDVVLFTRPRFEQEIQDGADQQGRRTTAGVARVCLCPYIRATRIPDCNCVDSTKVYESPLKKLHWLRIIIDEGHSFSNSMSNAVQVAKQIQAERRWVVSGTPAKNLVGFEVGVSSMDDNGDTASMRDNIMEGRKTFSHSDEESKATKALGSLASNFLMIRPWCDSAEGKFEWDEYVYRHEHQYKKTYSAFSTGFVRTLEGLVIKTRPEDVEKDIVLPPMTYRVVYLKPCWFDKMTANLFVQVLRANAITSEREGADYLFHMKSLKARHSLIRNLRQSNFTWTGFRLEDLVGTLEATQKYLNKEDKTCSLEDAEALRESSQIITELTTSSEWLALSQAHEVGMAVRDFPAEPERSFALAYPAKPTMIGLSQLIEGQLHVDSHIFAQNPADGLDMVGQTGRAKITNTDEVKETTKDAAERSNESQLTKTGVPLSCIGGQQPLTSRRTSTMTSKLSPQKTKQPPGDSSVAASPVRTRKRKLTLAEEQAELATNSELRKTCVIGTTSAKLTYLVDKVMQHQDTEKIIVFYDGDNAAYYIAQCLEVLYVNHRIYAKNLDHRKRSAYVAAFNQDPDIRVLLIDVACGAEGLNLNAASVVLIVNPINRPGTEAQAIKRAHRIGQTRPVLVEILVLENTIEHAIFERAKKMSFAQHVSAKELEDDEGIVEIIQNAQIHPVSPDEKGEGMYARLEQPQQVFGRPHRHKYHRFGGAGPKTSEKSQKKVKTVAEGAMVSNVRGIKTNNATVFGSTTSENTNSASTAVGGSVGEVANGPAVGPHGVRNNIFGRS